MDQKRFMMALHLDGTSTDHSDTMLKDLTDNIPVVAHITELEQRNGSHKNKNCYHSLILMSIQTSMISYLLLNTKEDIFLKKSQCFFPPTY